MKKLSISLLLFLLNTILPIYAVSHKLDCDCDCKATSKSFFSVRPAYQAGSPERLVHFRDRTEKREDGWAGAIEATVLGGKSRRNNRIAEYFMPECKTRLTIKEQLPTVADLANNDTDILANHLNIYTTTQNFESVITFEPQHSFIGVGLTWKQNLYQCENGRGFFGSISMPIMRVKNRINLSERIIDDGGGVNEAFSAVSENINNFPVVGTAKEAFAQAAWHCGKINDCCSENKETHLADVELALGYRLIEHETCSLESFVGATIATGNRPEGTYMFEPIVGNNKHNGIFWGSSIGMELWTHDCMDRALWFYVDYNGRYLFKTHETRLVDVKGKPWSRYMQLYCNQDQAIQAAIFLQQENLTSSTLLYTPGVNKFCLCLDVSPRFAHTFNTGFGYTSGCFDAEAGYNFYSRNSECVKLRSNFSETSAFKALSGGGQTDNVQTICNLFFNNNRTDVADFERNIIHAADLDLESAAHPSMMIHTFYGSVGYRWDDREYPLFAGIGSSYQFCDDNTGLSEWMLWGKAGISF
jgi:hypothetical protein